MNRSLFLPALYLFLIFDAPAGLFAQSRPETYIPPSDPLVIQNLKQWQGYKFGIIIHFGLYSKLGIVESWGLCPEEWVGREGYGDYCTFADDYRNTIRSFNPSGFDAEQWVTAIKNAGARYFIFTTKHHDGFCLYDSKYTDYKISSKSCPYGTSSKPDFTAELFEAGRRQGLSVGAYFSKPDWSSQDFWWSYYPPKDRNPTYDITKHPGRWQRFVTYTQNQINEITSRYGRIDILWLDGCWVCPKSSVNEYVAEFCKYPYDMDINMGLIAAKSRERQPGLIIVDRWVQGPYEDYLTPEQKIPDKALDVPWESCITMGNAWGWVPGDKYKSSRELVHLLAGIVAKGGNLLLGLGPDGNGRFEPAVYDRLDKMGLWLKENGEAIYGSVPVEPYTSGKIAFTAKGSDAIYAIYLTEEGEKELPREIDVKAAIKGISAVHLLAGGRKLNFRKTIDGLVVKIPENLRRTLADEEAVVIKISNRAGD